MDEGLELAVRSEMGIDALIHRFPEVSGLREKAIWTYDIQDGDIHRHDRYTWEYKNQRVTLLQVMFIGKTGYGKSSLLNAIVGQTLFEIDEVQSCTKKLDTVLYRMGQTDNIDYLALSDLPGVGESIEADKQYRAWYRDMLCASSCVVYVLRADQRDFSIDEDVFEELFPDGEQRANLVIALNFADKIEPISRDGRISEAQWTALEDKVDMIQELFDVYTVIPCCAKTGEGISKLVSEIVDILDLNVYDKV